MKYLYRFRSIVSKVKYIRELFFGPETVILLTPLWSIYLNDAQNERWWTWDVIEKLRTLYRFTMPVGQDSNTKKLCCQKHEHSRHLWRNFYEYDVKKWRADFPTRKMQIFNFPWQWTPNLIRSCVNFRCAIFKFSWFKWFSAYERIHKFHADFQWKSTHCIRTISTISLFRDNEMENVQILAPMEL